MFVVGVAVYRTVVGAGCVVYATNYSTKKSKAQMISSRWGNTMSVAAPANQQTNKPGNRFGNPNPAPQDTSAFGVADSAVSEARSWFLGKQHCHPTAL